MRQEFFGYCEQAEGKDEPCAVGASVVGPPGVIDPSDGTKGCDEPRLPLGACATTQAAEADGPAGLLRAWLSGIKPGQCYGAVDAEEPGRPTVLGCVPASA